jgi:hypothetical protein
VPKLFNHMLILNIDVDSMLEATNITRMFWSLVIVKVHWCVKLYKTIDFATIITIQANVNPKP